MRRRSLLADPPRALLVPLTMAVLLLGGCATTVPQLVDAAHDGMEELAEQDDELAGAVAARAWPSGARVCADGWAAPCVE